ncbi:DUF3870 domain-containing protein [Acetoanaerobium noterae]|uniref:DUF3870 domain-containing protein n=1 Tax=Acetoanaerobium noterae TaxID=745369 RepID=UPI0028AF422B|nr:DUF3870 domain-containing protein [Acetoanaerobium noterae]
MYPDTTVYIIGHARTQADNAITEHFKGFFIGVVVDYTTDEIVDISCSSTIPTTEKFIQSLFINKKLDKYYGEIDRQIEQRYFGTSQKALSTAYKDAVKRYAEAKEKYYK